jgi:hypothetical protein
MSELPAQESRGIIGKLPLTLQSAMGNWFAENASMGQGDLRTPVTLEALQRTETSDYWVVNRKKLGRAEVMELMIDMVAGGYSVPALLQVTGMPKPRTIMSWLQDYKPFADMMETAEKMRAVILAEQALDIVDATEDPKMAFRDKTRADMRMRMAEIFNPKKFGKKQLVDVTHHMDDLSGDEVWSRFRSILISHQDMIQSKTGIKIEVPIQDAEIVNDESLVAPVEQDFRTLGMQGVVDPTPGV